MSQQSTRVDARGGRIRGREQATDIWSAGGAQDGISESMQHHITVGVTEQARRIGDLQTTQAEAVGWTSVAAGSDPGRPPVAGRAPRMASRPQPGREMLEKGVTGGHSRTTTPQVRGYLGRSAAPL